MKEARVGIEDWRGRDGDGNGDDNESGGRQVLTSLALGMVALHLGLGPSVDRYTRYQFDQSGAYGIGKHGSMASMDMDGGFLLRFRASDPISILWEHVWRLLGISDGVGRQNRGYSHTSLSLFSCSRGGFMGLLPCVSLICDTQRVPGRFQDSMGVCLWPGSGTERAASAAQFSTVEIREDTVVADLLRILESAII